MAKIFKSDKSEEKYRKLSFELDRQKFRYSYWHDAEKLEFTIITLIFGSVLIPTLINFEFNFKKLNTWLLILEVLVFTFLVRRKIGKYQKEQKNAKDKIENLEI